MHRTGSHSHLVPVPRWSHLAVARHLVRFLDSYWSDDKRALIVGQKLGMHARPGKRGFARTCLSVAEHIAQMEPKDISRLLGPLLAARAADMLEIANMVASASSEEERLRAIASLAREHGVSWLLFWAIAVLATHPVVFDLIEEYYAPFYFELDHTMEWSMQAAAETAGQAPAGLNGDGKQHSDERQEIESLRRELDGLRKKLQDLQRQAADSRKRVDEAELRAAELTRELERVRKELHDERATSGLLLQWVEDLAREPNWDAVISHLERRRAELLQQLASDPGKARELVAVEEFLAWLRGNRIPAGAHAKAQERPGDGNSGEQVRAPDADLSPPEQHRALEPGTGTPVRVLLVGGAREEPYRSRFESEGFAFEWLDGDARGEALRAAVRRADVVVLMLTHASHATSGAVFSMLRETGKVRRCIIPRSPGVSGILRAVREVVQRALAAGDLTRP